MRTTISNYRVLFDRQSDGYPASTGSLSLHDGHLTLVFLYASDAARGLPQYRVDSDDLGRTWSEPQAFGTDLKLRDGATEPGRPLPAVSPALQLPPER